MPHASTDVSNMVMINVPISLKLFKKSLYCILSRPFVALNFRLVSTILWSSGEIPRQEIFAINPQTVSFCTATYTVWLAHANCRPTKYRMEIWWNVYAYSTSAASSVGEIVAKFVILCDWNITGFPSRMHQTFPLSAFVYLIFFKRIRHFWDTVYDNV